MKVRSLSGGDAVIIAETNVPDQDLDLIESVWKATVAYRQRSESERESPTEP